jgi:hypothetical protein
VNCNATGDTSFTVPLPSGVSNWRIKTYFTQGLTGTFTTAKFGLYSAASQGGTALLGQTALSAITTTALNTAGNGTQSSGAGGTAYNFTTLYLNIGTPQGSTCTMNAYLEIQPLP